jgi:hypothetical protein
MFVTAALSGKQVQEITGAERLGLIIHFLDDAFFHYLKVAIGWEETVDKCISVTWARIEEVEVRPVKIGVRQTCILQDGDRERPTHGSGLSIDADVIKILGDYHGVFI